MRTAPFPGIDLKGEGERPLLPRELFGNDHSVVLEIGSGKGRFLRDSARANPSRNYLGIERSLHFYRHIVDRLERADLQNARIVNYHAEAVLASLLPEKSISEVHIYFPDPWPRPRERKRRFARDESMLALIRVMKSDGFGVFVTDHREYFLKAVPVFSRHFSVESGEVVPGNPRTNYEEKYQIEGRPMWEILFRPIVAP